MYTGTEVTGMFLRGKGGKIWYFWQECFTRLVGEYWRAFFLVYHWCGNQDEFPKFAGIPLDHLLFSFGTAPTLS